MVLFLARTGVTGSLSLDLIRRFRGQGLIDPTDPKANVAAIAATNLATIVGPVKFGSEALPPFARKNI